MVLNVVWIASLRPDWMNIELLFPSFSTNENIVSHCPNSPTNQQPGVQSGRVLALHFQPIRVRPGPLHPPIHQSRRLCRPPRDSQCFVLVFFSLELKIPFFKINIFYFESLARDFIACHFDFQTYFSINIFLYIYFL